MLALIGWSRSPVLLFYGPVSPSRSKDRCTVCSSLRLLGAGGSRLLWHEPETSTASTSLTAAPLYLSSILGVFHLAGGPIPTPLLCLGQGCRPDVQTEPRRGPGFALSAAGAKRRSKLVAVSHSFSGPNVCQGLKGHQKNHIFV